MPATITLRTLPGKISHEHGCKILTLELFGDSLGRYTTTVSNVVDIKTAVAHFGASVRSSHPTASFYVSIALAKGCRKPNGYGAATKGNGVGQEEFLHTEDSVENAGGETPTPDQPDPSTPPGHVATQHA